MPRKRRMEVSSRSSAMATMMRSLSTRGGGRFLSDLSSLHFWVALLFVLICVLPIIGGIYPLPYFLGYVASNDVVSRVDFEYEDPTEKEREIAQIEANFHNRYVQESEYSWLSRISTPVWHLIEKADRLDDPAKLLAYAAEQKLELTQEQATILVGALQGRQDQINPYSDIVSPMQYVLRERIFRFGLLDSERYRLERGRFIRIQMNDRDERTVRVSRNDPLSPLDPLSARSILDQGFAESRMPVRIEFRSALRDVLLKRLVPSLTFDEDGSRQELSQLKDRIRIQKVVAGETRLLERGERVTPNLFERLREEEQRYRDLQGWRATSRQVAGKAFLLFLLAVAFLMVLGHTPRALLPKGRDLVCVVLLVLCTMLSAHATLYYGFQGTMIPFGLLAGSAAFLLGTRLSFVLTTCAGLMLAILLEGQIGTVLSFMGAGWAFVIVLPSIRNRLSFVSAATACGLLAMLIVLGWGFATGEGLEIRVSFLKQLIGGQLVGRSAATLVVWMSAGVVMILFLPLLERFCGLTTNVRLHELQDQDQPLLRQLVVEAPGTYHHSVIVGTLAEAAAEAVGANPLLAKVGSYYHDIGKLMKPEYFSENESGVSRHDSIRPTMSSLIITAHVKDGAEMGREFGLPPGIVDIIEQHHGTGVVSYFYHRARKQAEEGESVKKSTFRYPGPVPQTAEAALVSLADSVEAATRSLEDPTPTHIRRLVHELILGRLSDGQLAQAGLNLSDLEQVEEVFFRVLTSMFHSRVKYPGQEKEEKRRRR